MPTARYRSEADETIGDLTGAGTIDKQRKQSHRHPDQRSGLQWQHHRRPGGLAKQGEAGSHPRTNGSDFTGDRQHQRGNPHRLRGNLATNTINVANGATLTTTAAELLNNAATLTADGTVNLGGNETIANLLGADTGEVNIGANNLLLTGGVDFQGRINGNGGSVDATGPGDIILGGENTFTGELTVLSGSTTTLTGSVDGDVDVNAGGELTLGSAERIADGCSTERLMASSTPMARKRSPPSLPPAPSMARATVSALTYDLNGATANANLGTGALTSNGDTALNGRSANADSVTVVGGTLTVDGALNNNTASPLPW